MKGKLLTERMSGKVLGVAEWRNGMKLLRSVREAAEVMK